MVGLEALHLGDLLEEAYHLIVELAHHQTVELAHHQVHDVQVYRHLDGDSPTILLRLDLGAFIDGASVVDERLHGLVHSARGDRRELAAVQQLGRVCLSEDLRQIKVSLQILFSAGIMVGGKGRWKFVCRVPPERLVPKNYSGTIPGLAESRPRFWTTRGFISLPTESSTATPW